jgi:hypothetical protein
MAKFKVKVTRDFISDPEPKGGILIVIALLLFVVALFFCATLLP